MHQREVQILFFAHMVVEQPAHHGHAHLNVKLLVEKVELLVVDEHYEIAKHHLFVWKAAVLVTAHYIRVHLDEFPRYGWSTGVR